MEDELFEEMGGQVEAGADVALAQPGLRSQHERRQFQQLVGIGGAGVGADGAAGAGADPDQVVHGPGDSAAAEVEAEAKVLQQSRLEAHEDGGPDVGPGEG